MAQETPMMKQYKEIKNAHKDAILFFRLGDFYEMFYDDAVLASKELEITLTGRGQDEKRMPMCGIPFHAADSYVSKLIGRGYKVAICEQVEDPKQAKGIVRREVIKVITPGTVLDTKMLEEKSNNYLAGVSFDKDIIGFAYIDVSTGEFKATEIHGKDAFMRLKDELERISPKECLIPDIIPDNYKELNE
ncbi:DNA mismatch repair protein MutS, partial [Candidatus Margulisiibacteriota bacterium]